MTRFVAAAALAAAIASAPAATAQDREVKAITARVHGTFEDKAGGLGVLYGDLRIERFDVVNGIVVATGEATGTLSDSGGTQLGRIRQTLTLPVSNAASTCNQLQMDLAGSDEIFLQVLVTLDKQTAGFDSRHGTTPAALDVLCRAMGTLRGTPAPAAVAQALNEVAAAIGSNR